MIDEHYIGLLAGYALAVIGWWAIFALRSRIGLFPERWAQRRDFRFNRPWAELGFALLGAVGVIAVGRLWAQGWMLPAPEPLGALVESLNQLLIFLPILLVPLIRRHGIETMLLPKEGAAIRLLVGLALAAVALTAFWIARRGTSNPVAMIGRIPRFENLDELTQILLEDLAIGILLVRLAACISTRWTVITVAALFVLGHVPTMVANGVTAPAFAGLIADFGLGLIVLGTVLRSGDVLWFWPVHAAMDMTQFARVSVG